MSLKLLQCLYCWLRTRGGFRIAATSKMERFVIIVNGWMPLTIITKRSILDVAAVLDPPLRADTIQLRLRATIAFIIYLFCDYLTISLRFFFDLLIPDILIFSIVIVWKVSKYGSDKTPYLDTFRGMR